MTIVDTIRKNRLQSSQKPILDIFKKRFSPRVFSDTPVPHDDIDTIIEAARLAPSGRNHQPWFFYIATVGTKEYDMLFTCIPERNMWAKTAPVLLVACVDPMEPKDGTNIWAQYDLGAAVMSLVLQATAMGYNCRQIGSFDKDKTKQTFNIPDPFFPFIIITLGKMGEEKDYEKADALLVEKDTAPNPRKTAIAGNLKIK